MKKVLKIVGIVLLVFIGLLLVLPFLFQDKIKDVAVSEVNKMLNAEVYTGDFSLSFFRHFPNAAVTIENFGVVGVDEFSGDTLADVKKLGVVINLASLFKDSYEINEIELIDAKVLAKVMPDGKANWDIMKSDSTEVEETESDTSSSAFKLALDNFTIENLSVVYDDRMDSMYADVNNLNLNMSGNIELDLQALADIDNFKLQIEKVVYADQKSNMNADLKKIDLTFSGKVSESISHIKTLFETKELSFSMDNVPYLSNANVNADIELDADLVNNKYTFADNSISLNEIQANFAGFVQLFDDGAMDMDLSLNTPNIDFKQILSLIPVIYANNFSSIKTDGKVALNAKAKGRMQGDTLPAFDANLDITDAMFKYPDLPSSVNAINISLKANNPGGIADLTVVDVPKFSFSLAESPFALTLSLKTPISDPDFSFTANGTLNLGKLSEVLYLNDMSMQGILTAGLDIAGKMSYIEQNKYDLFKIAGNLNLKNFSLKMSSLDYLVNIENAGLGFSAQNVALDAKLGLGKSDLTLKGQLQNFLQYVMLDQTIKGSLSVNSNLLNVTELMGESDTTASTQTASTDTSSMSVVDIPGNIDFALNVAVNKLIYDGIELSEMKGALTVKDKVAKINSLVAKTMGGSLNVAGTYDVVDTLQPKVDLDLKVKEMSISQVFTTVSTANKLAPVLEDAKGNFSLSMSFFSVLDQTMSPVMNTIDGKGNFSSKEISLKDVTALQKISELVKYPSLSDPTIKDLDVDFTIKDGKLTTDPFETNINKALLKVSGSSGLDQTLDYVTTISLPNSVSSTIPLAFDVKIGGTFTSPKVSLGAESTVNAVKEAVKEKVTEAVDEAKEKALSAAKEQKEKLIAEAKTQREKLISEATKMGDKLVVNAQAQSDSIQAKATNPLSKAAAKKTGDALVSKAKKNAEKLVTDATTSGDKLVTTAEKEGDALISKASK